MYAEKGETTYMADETARPLISLLIPIYNVEKYLRECLDSARNQTLEDIEVICINDGSTDSSPDIIREYMTADGRFRMIDKENSGYGSSMNMGLDAARGEYVGILESDDFLDANALEEMYKAACDADADVVKADFYLYWSQPEPRDERFGWVAKEKAGLNNPQEDDTVYYLKPSIWSAIYKRSFLESNDVRFLETPGASYQDAGFNFKVWTSAERVVLLDRAYLHYRQDNEASSVNSPGKVYCVCDEYAEMLRYLDARPEKKERLLPVLVKMRYDSYMWNYERLSEPLQREFVMRMAEDFRKEDAAGITDYDLFEPWKKADRKFIMDRPDLFHLQRTEHAKPGKLNTAKRYYEMGGFPLLLDMVKNKIGH